MKQQMLEKRKTEEGIENVRQEHIFPPDLLITSKTVLRKQVSYPDLLFVDASVKKLEKKRLNSNCKETECQNETSAES